MIITALNWITIAHWLNYGQPLIPIRIVLTTRRLLLLQLLPWMRHDTTRHDEWRVVWWLMVLVVVDDKLTQSRCDFCHEYQGCHYHRKFNKLRYHFTQLERISRVSAHWLISITNIGLLHRITTKTTRFPFLPPQVIFTMENIYKHDKGTHFKNDQSSEKIRANVNHVM